MDGIMNDDLQNDSIMSLADRYMFQTYGRFPVALIRGEGCRVWDEKGKEYLDFVGGIAVCALGHSSPIVSRTLEEQSKRLVHVSNLYYTKPQVELAKLLVENSFADRVFFCNSGAEANEAAIKLARRYTNEKFGPDRHMIISMDNSFHGRTMATFLQRVKARSSSGLIPCSMGSDLLHSMMSKALTKLWMIRCVQLLLNRYREKAALSARIPGI